MPNNDSGQAQPARNVQTAGPTLTTRQQQHHQEAKRAEWENRQRELKESAARPPAVAAAAAGFAAIPGAPAGMQSGSAVHAQVAQAASESTADWLLGSARRVFDDVATIAPDIPNYGTIIGIVARIGSALIAEEPVAVQLFDQIMNTVHGGTPPDDAKLAEWAKMADEANDTLGDHIAAQIKAKTGTG